MQTDTKDKEQATLPIPFSPESIPEKEKKTSKSALAKVNLLLRAASCTVALAALIICAAQKLDTVFSKGIIEHISDELLSNEKENSLGNTISNVAFGAITETVEKATDDTPKLMQLTLPRIYYVPKEELQKIISEEKRTEDEKKEDLYFADISDMPNGYYPIIPTDASASSHRALKNDTSFSIDMALIADEATNLSKAEITKDPLVLVVHTHGTESFSDGEHDYYNDSFNHPRNEDVSKNIVAVGKVLCDTLNESGIPTIHCEIMHDKDSYIKAYDRSAESIRHYLEKYPSIQYVFDVHRDSLIRSDLTKLRPVTLKSGTPCAQIMMIIGSDEKWDGTYSWKSNLVLASAIQQNLFEDAKGVARQLYLRGATYNQQYAKHGLLLEIGSCGNSLDEAKEAAKVFADAFIKVVKIEN